MILKINEAALNMTRMHSQTAKSRYRMELLVVQPIDRVAYLWVGLHFYGVGALLPRRNPEDKTELFGCDSLDPVFV